jgi:uncharacterized protein (DUF2237 family)
MFDNTFEKPQKPEKQLNVLGTNLEVCGTDPMTGFYRDGCCNTGNDDAGTHTVCVIVTDEFLKFSKSKGNDLSTPIPQYGFAGLKAGDAWCLVALRWEEARMAGAAPRIKITATNIKTLEYVDLASLKEHQIDLN